MTHITDCVSLNDKIMIIFIVSPVLNPKRPTDPDRVTYPSSRETFPLLSFLASSPNRTIEVFELSPSGLCVPVREEDGQTQTQIVSHRMRTFGDTSEGGGS